MSLLQLDEFKTKQRATWEGGDYSACSPYIAEVGQLVVTHAGISPGMRVLDVACGTGNAALPAARAGARVTGLDLAAKLLDAGRAKAKAEGFEFEWLGGRRESPVRGRKLRPRALDIRTHVKGDPLNAYHVCRP